MRRVPLLLALLLLITVPVLSRAEDQEAEEVRITADYREADAREVLVDLARQAGANLIIPEDFQGTVTMAFQAVPWRVALEQVVRTAGFALVTEDYGILRVMSAGPELQTAYHRFRHRAPRVDDATREDPGTEPPPPAIVAALRPLVAPENGDLRYVPAQHSVVFTGTPRTLATVKAILEAYDQPTATEAETRRFYEQLLAEARTETAAEYFRRRLEGTRDP